MQADVSVCMIINVEGGRVELTRKRDPASRLGIARPNRVPLGHLAEHIYSRPVSERLPPRFTPIYQFAPDHLLNTLSTPLTHLNSLVLVKYFIYCRPLVPVFPVPSSILIHRLLLRPFTYFTYLVHFNSSHLCQPPHIYTYTYTYTEKRYTLLPLSTTIVA